MASETYIPIADSEIDPESAGTSPLFYKLRDNPLAMFAGAAGAPKLGSGVFNAPAGHIYLGSESDGAKIVSASENLPSGEYHYSSLTINNGQTLGCSDSHSGFLIIRVTGELKLIGTASINLNEKGGMGAVAATTEDAFSGSGGFGGGSGGGGGCSLSYDGGLGGDSNIRNHFISGGAKGEYLGGTGEDGGNGSNSTSEMTKILTAYSGLDVYKPYGAGGGGAGAEITCAAGANGGGGVIIIANSIVLESGSTITCNGGNGGDPVGGNCGGRGAGGGGVVILVANTVSNLGSITTNGGLAGTNNAGAASAGGSGGNGHNEVITVG